jgi:hemerythrin-like domain-containing protein
MQLIRDLYAEHDLIERVSGALLTFVRVQPERRAAGDAARFIRFFTDFAGQYHHAREEDTLFVALRERAGLPEDGPIRALTTDHRRLAGLLEAVIAGLNAGGAGPELDLAATEYVHGLWRHIDAENSVLFPESESRLKKHGVRELPARPPTSDEVHARGAAEELVSRYPPPVEATALRGDGCVCCPMMAVTCGGFEQAWWNEWEWEELDDHLAGG